MHGGDEPALELDGGHVRFQRSGSGADEGISEFALELGRELPAGAQSIEVGGVRIARLATSGR